MVAWLTPAEAAELVDVSSSVANGNAPDWVGAVRASMEFVEDKRKDLLAGDPALFVAGPMIKLGTAMLANRLYTRLRSPLGTSSNVEFGGSDFLRQDPDIARLLGLGISGKFAFGAAGYVPVVVVP